MRRAALAAVAIAALVIAAAAGCRGTPRTPAAAACKDAAARVASALREVRAELSEASLDPTPDVTELCLDDKWTPAVITCFAGASTAKAHRGCADGLSPPQREHARVVQDDLFDRAAAVLRERRRNGGGTGITECDAYVEAVGELEACGKAPRRTVQGMVEALDQSRDAWTQLADSDDEAVRRALALGCAEAAATVQRQLAALGC